MIDGDDVHDWVFFINPTTPLGFVFWIVGLAILIYCCSVNEETCATKMQCRNGATARLMDNECRCVEMATPIHQ